MGIETFYGDGLSVSKRVLVHNLWLEMSLIFETMNVQTSFQYERLRAKTRFEAEARVTRKWRISNLFDEVSLS